MPYGCGTRKWARSTDHFRRLRAVIFESGCGNSRATELRTVLLAYARHN
jgi:hypothetical protein